MKHFSPIAGAPRNIFIQILRAPGVLWRVVLSRVVMPVMPAGKKPGIATAIVVLAVLSVSRGESQGLDQTLAVSSECTEWILKAMAHVEAGLLADADAELAAALTKVENDTAHSCTGLILHNMATIASISGRYAEGERLALRSIAALEKVDPPNPVALLRPLLVLTGTRLEQGNKSGARSAFNRLKEIRPEQPHERAMIHAMTGTLLHSVGDRQQAEVEFLAALDAWTEIGRGEMADAGSVLTSLGSLYIEERRFEDAQRSVDRASAIFSQTTDAAPIDRSKLLGVRGVLHARRREWPSAEKDFRDALSLADGQPAVGTEYILFLLTGFAEALHENHHQQEARGIKARAAALRRVSPLNTVVDVSDLVARRKPMKK